MDLNLISDRLSNLVSLRLYIRQTCTKALKAGEDHHAPSETFIPGNIDQHSGKSASPYSPNIY
jgi:hypothetical protein